MNYHKLLIFLIGFLFFSFNSEANYLIGKIEFKKGHISYRGTSYLIDENSQSNTGAYQCGSKRIFVTANHVLQGAEVGSTAKVFFPWEDPFIFQERGSIFIEAKIISRDIASDLALLEPVKSRQNSAKWHTLEKLSKKKFLCVGLNASTKVEETLRMQAYTYNSDYPSFITAERFGMVKYPNFIYAYRNNPWYQIKTPIQPGMSGGLFTLPSLDNPIAMIFKRYTGQNETMALAIPFHVVAKKIKSLLHALKNKENIYRFKYLPRTEEVVHKGLHFKEINGRTARDFKVTPTWFEDTSGKGEFHNVAGQKINPLALKNSAVYLSYISKGTEPYRRYKDQVGKNRLFVVYKANGQKITSLSTLLNIIETSDIDKEIEFEILIKSLNGEISHAYIGDDIKVTMQNMTKLIFELFESYKNKLSIKMKNSEMKNDKSLGHLFNLTLDVQSISSLLISTKNERNVREHINDMLLSINSEDTESLPLIYFENKTEEQKWRSFQKLVFFLQKKFRVMFIGKQERKLWEEWEPDYSSQQLGDDN